MALIETIPILTSIADCLLSQNQTKLPTHKRWKIKEHVAFKSALSSWSHVNNGLQYDPNG